MGTKSPSKYMSLSLLESIQSDNYSTRYAEYDQYEVDKLIIEKRDKLAEKSIKKSLADHEGKYQYDKSRLLTLVKALNNSHDFISESTLLMVANELAPHIGDFK